MKKVLKFLLSFVLLVGILSVSAMASGETGAVVFYDAADDSVLPSFYEETSVYAKVSFIAPKSGDASVIAAQYTADGKMIKADLLTTELAMVSGETVNYETADISVEGAETLKIFVWEGLSSFVPILDAPAVLEKKEPEPIVDKFTAKEDLTFTHVKENGTIEKTLGDIFEAIDGANINSATVEVTVGEGCTYAKNAEEWKASTLSFTGTGDVTITITDNINCNVTTATITVVEPERVEKFTTKSVSMKAEQTVTLGELFAEKTDVTVFDEDVTIEVTDAEGNSHADKVTYVEDDADWTKSTLTVDYAGSIKVAISDNNFCTATVLETEVAALDKFTAKENLTFTHVKENGTIEKTLGDIFTAIEGTNINSATVEVTVGEGCTYAKNAEDWKASTLSFTGTGDVAITIVAENTNAVTATVVLSEPEDSKKFDLVFENTDKYMYRVGNGGVDANGNPVNSPVALKSLFKAVEGAQINGDVTVTVESVYGDAVEGIPTYKADWTTSQIEFNNTGVVKVTITDNNFCIPTELYLEVVDAVNVTDNSQLKNYNVTQVLLKDVSCSSLYLNGGATLYGNGFSLDCTNAAYSGTGSVSENYVIALDNAHLDNIRIIGKVYTEYGAMADKDYNRALVVSKGNSTITNCYLSNTAAPVRLIEGTLSIKDSTIKGGNFANIDVRNGHLITEDIITINQALGNDKADNGNTVIGLGIVFYYENVDPNLTSVTVNGSLTQYNHISKNDEFSNSYANQLVTEIFNEKHSDLQYTEDGVKWVDTGIISMADGMDKNVFGMSDRGYGEKAVTFMGINGYVFAKKPTAESIKTVPSEYKTIGQGVIAPSYVFDYTTKNYIAKTENSNDYCYYDNGKVLIAMDEGDSFEWDTSILTVTKNGTALDYTVSMNGVDYTGRNITFSTSGEYTVTYSYTDEYNYTLENGEVKLYEERYTQTVTINVSVIKPTTKNATFTFADTNTDTEKITLNNKTYISATGVSETDKEWGYITVNGTKIFYPITEAQMKKNTFGNEVQVYYYVFKDAVTITDYKDGGTGSEVIYNSSTTTMPGNLSVVNGMEAKYTAISSACVDISKLTKDGPSGEVWDFSASSTVSGATKYNNYLAHSSPSGLAIKSGTRDYDAITVAQFSYTDNAGATYYYFIGYFMPNQVSSGGDSGDNCITPETLITLADGSQKEVQDLTGDEMLLVWNLETGAYDEAPIVFIDVDEEKEFEVINLQFSDGTEVGVIYEHGFFDMNLGKYVYIDEHNAEDYIGHSFVKQADTENNEWKMVTLDNVVFEKRLTKAYSPVTYKHLCYYTDGMLSMPGGIEGLFNIFEVDINTMSYDAEKKTADIEKYGLFAYEDFVGVVSDGAFEAFNGEYFKVAIGKGILTWDEVEYLAKRYADVIPSN